MCVHRITAHATTGDYLSALNQPVATTPSYAAPAAAAPAAAAPAPSSGKRMYFFRIQ